MGIRKQSIQERLGDDRRSQPTPALSRYSFWGRRRKVRRVREREIDYFTDVYSARRFMLTLAVILLSLLDAMLTLRLLQMGAYEANPVMAHFLEMGEYAFLAAKYALTAIPILLLLIHGNVRLFRTRLRAKYLLVAFSLLFIGVIIWELYLFLHVLP